MVYRGLWHKGNWNWTWKFLIDGLTTKIILKGDTTVRAIKMRPFFKDDWYCQLKGSTSYYSLFGDQIHSTFNTYLLFVSRAAEKIRWCSI